MGTPATDAHARLQGRERELAAVRQALDQARTGTSAVLILRGEPGIGKTALLSYAADQAAGMRTVSVAGIESETELAFAFLHQLCTPLLERLPQLPQPQHDALSVAFGLQQGTAPNRFLLGLAVLSLLSAAAEEKPLALLIDDAQWLDEGSKQVLAFVARRLMAEPVAFLFALRRPDDDRALAGLPELTLHPLAAPDARALLASAVHVPLDPQVQDRIIAEAQGNPMALLHLPRRLTPTELAGGFWLPGVRPLTSSIENALYQCFSGLPSDTRQLMVIAAAEATGDADLLWRAARLQGVLPDAAAPAETAGLIDIGVTVRFHHPLLRSVVYARAPAPQRRAAHQALAQATDPHQDPDRRAWHRAHAATRPDEDIALDLEHSADRAQSRGGTAAAASFLQRAAELTPDPALRTARTLAAAQTHIDAGGINQALTLLSSAQSGPLDHLQHARLERLRAQLVFSRTRGCDAPRLLLQAAQRLAPLDTALARDTLLEAAGAAIFAGRLGQGPGLEDIALAARATPLPATPPRITDTLLDAITSLTLDGCPAGAHALRNALDTLRRHQRNHTPGSDRHWLWLAFRVTPEPFAPELWDDDAWHELATGAVRLARQAGALAVLPMALTYQACYDLLGGRLDTAAALVDEATAISQAVGGTPMMHISLILAAWHAPPDEALDHIDSTVREVTTRGEGRALSTAHYATALLHNSLGRYADALTAAQQACAYEDFGIHGWALTELIEAATRTGHRETAEEALARLTLRTSAVNTHWAQGTQACASALVADDDTADTHYRQAIHHLRETHVTLNLARAHLLYGEWLRRHHERRQARTHLRTAYQTFHHAQACHFTERARKELQAAGDTTNRPATANPATQLTHQEAQIAALARAGNTNTEIATQLFISPRTVEWHLTNIYNKLNIRTRRQLPTTHT